MINYNKLIDKEINKLLNESVDFEKYNKILLEHTLEYFKYTKINKYSLDDYFRGASEPDWFWLFLNNLLKRYNEDIYTEYKGKMIETSELVGNTFTKYLNKLAGSHFRQGQWDYEKIEEWLKEKLQLKESILKEQITKDSIKELQKEAQLYNKAIMKIDSPYDLYEVSKSMQDYSIKLHDYLENTLNSRIENTGWKDGHGNDFSFYPFQEFYQYLREVLDPYKLSGIRRAYDDWNKYDENIWVNHYSSFEKRRKSLYTMFSQKLKKAFDNLQDWLDTFTNGYAPNRSSEELITYNGFKIKVTSDEAHSNFLNSRGSNSYSVEDFKKDLDNLVHDLKSKSISPAFLKNAVFEFNNTISLDIGGDYQATGNIISVLPDKKESYTTLVHEVGHCYEVTVISKQARSAWQEFYSDPKNFVYISDETKNNIKKELEIICSSKEIKDGYEENKYNHNGLYSIKNKIRLQLLAKFNKNSTEYKLLTTLFNDIKIEAIDYLPSKPDDIDFFMSILNNHELGGVLFQDRIILNNMSLYSAKNEKEAFAEMFMYYVLDYHKQKDFSVDFIHFFKSIIGVSSTINESVNITTWYHGSPDKITHWSTEFMGIGDDQEGAGIYFTSNYDDASGYSKNKGYVYEVELHTTKWMSTKAKPKVIELKKLIELADDYETTLGNWGNEDPAKDMRDCLNDYLQYNKTMFEAVKSVCNDFYRYDSAGYCNAIMYIGYGGVIVPKNLGVFHAIVWNPKIIKNIS